MNEKITLLDCTLRDGGYINNWRFGQNNAHKICEQLVKARIDIVEVGFFRDCNYDPDIMRFNTLEQAESIIPEDRGKTRFVAMALNGTYNISNLVDFKGGAIDAIRVAFHPYDIDEGIEFCRITKEKGYRSYCQPINLMGYTDYELLNIIERVNKVKPHTFAIVDTFGAMMKEDLLRLCALVNHNLDQDIGLGIHVHENLGLAFSLAQEFLSASGVTRRNINIDASLSGMGRVPGNLCIELIADYLNRYYGAAYDLNPMFDAIEDYILAFKDVEAWGYSPAYFLSAKYGVHRNYAEDLLARGCLKTRDIGQILEKISGANKSVFNKEYTNKLFYEYQNISIDDEQSFVEIKEMIGKSPVLLLAPGSSLNCASEKEKIENCIREEKPIIICVNFECSEYNSDFVFYSNTKRYGYKPHSKSKVIITSNLLHENNEYDYVLNYNRLAQGSIRGENSVVLVLHLLEEIGTKEVYLAGVDGYMKGKNNYCTNEIGERHSHDEQSNIIMKKQLKHFSSVMRIHFATPSLYEDF